MDSGKTATVEKTESRDMEKTASVTSAGRGR